MSTTRHAHTRAQQRGIPPLIDQWLDAYGEEEYDGRGGITRYFSSRSLRAMERDFGRAPVAHRDEGPDHLRRHLARDLAAAVAPEPVGHDQQDLAALCVVPAEEGVLVDPADDADVGRSRDRRLTDAPGRVPIGIGGVEGHGIPEMKRGGGRSASDLRESSRSRRRLNRPLIICRP